MNKKDNVNPNEQVELIQQKLVVLENRLSQHTASMSLEISQLRVELSKLTSSSQ